MFLFWLCFLFILLFEGVFYMPTSRALIGSYSGADIPHAWPQVTPNGVTGSAPDLFQIIGIGGSILVNVDSQGNVHNPAVNPTVGRTRIGQFFTRLTSAASLASIFADVFSNPSQLDIIQVTVPLSGFVHHNISVAGVASGS
jgi:hypothetical protein